MSFVNRERELASLDAVHARSGAQLIGVFGRRRIGKTSLLLRWLEREPAKESAYWVAHRSTSARLLEGFSRALQPLLGASDPGFRFSSWEAALEELARLAARKRIVVVLDELPYLLESVPSFATQLQAAWDHKLKHSRVRLALAGSHYHMMHSLLSSPRGALFGRTTADLLVDELDLEAMSELLPAYSPEQLVETYSVIGGVPKYLEMWNDRRPVLANVERVVLGPETIFRTEPVFLVHDEIADPRTYVAVLEAIGLGARRPVEIARGAGVNLAHVGKYLHTLEMLRFTRRVTSVEGSSSARSRNAHHEIRDAYLRFHFAFVQPHLRLLEYGRMDRLMQIIRAGFDAHVGRTAYEEICRRHVAALADRGELPFEALDVGRLWDRRTEIDVAAFDSAKSCALVAECRWRRKRMDEQVLDQLIAKAKKPKALHGLKLCYALFSRAGFTRKLERRAAAEGVLLFAGVPPALVDS